MKRCICLSALLVGLSMTSIAAAAPPAASAPPTTAEKPKLVAQAAGIGTDVAQTDGSGTGTAPGTAPADGSTPTSSPQPALSIGGSTSPAKDKPQEAAEEPKAAPKPRPFAGTQIYATTSMSTATIFRGQQQDYNPTAEQALWLLPRYALSKDFQLRGRLIASYEFTNSDSSTYQNEPLLSDTTVQLFYRGIPEIAGFHAAVSLNVGAPTSKLSRARNQVFTPGVGAQLVRSIEHVLGGELFLMGSAIYSHPVYSERQSTVADLRSMQTFQCVGGINCGDLLSGTMNPSDTLAYMFLVGGEWGKFAPAIMYFGGSSWAYRPKQDVMESDVVPGGNNVPVTGAVNPTNVNQSHYVNAFLDYHFNNWFTGEVGYWLRRSALNEAGKYGNPFWDRYQDMRVYLGLNINIDSLMQTLEGGEADAGIVRAQNTKRPFFTF